MTENKNQKKNGDYCTEKSMFDGILSHVGFYQTGSWDNVQTVSQWTYISTVFPDKCLTLVNKGVPPRPHPVLIFCCSVWLFIIIPLHSK